MKIRFRIGVTRILACCATRAVVGEPIFRRGHAQTLEEARVELKQFRASYSSLAEWEAKADMMVFNVDNPYPTNAVQPNTRLPG